MNLTIGENKLDSPRLLIITTMAVTLRAFLLPYAKHFRKFGWRVDGMASGINNCAECVNTFNNSYEMEWNRNPFNLPRLAESVKKVRRVVMNGNYDIVHVHTPVASFVSRLALRHHCKSSSKVIYTAHGFHFHPRGNFLKNQIFLFLERLAGRWTDALVVINNADATEAKRRKIVDPRRLFYMPGIGIDIDSFDPKAISRNEVESVRNELKIGENQVLFLMVAEFTPNKRQRDALGALGTLSRPNVCLAFAGEGKCLTDARQFAKKLCVERQTRFLGQRRDIPMLMRASRALILCSAREGLPRSVMEALSLEVPVIGTRIRGTADLVDSFCGKLIEVGDITELANAMAWFSDHPIEASTMGRQGRARMQEYQLKKVIELHEQLYATLLDK